MMVLFVHTSGQFNGAAMCRIYDVDPLWSTGVGTPWARKRGLRD
jgi:hypothetical protein